jgi:outer membrane protein OmpA-like peptidoglycan-associated protein/opacity protein-like surface antigen
MINRRLIGTAVALGVVLAAARAHAQWNMFGPFPPGAFYLGPEGGWTHLTTRSNTGNFTVPATAAGPARTIPYSETTHFDSGFNAGARAGYRWGPWRFEEEYSYRYDALSAFSAIIGSRVLNGLFSGSAHSNAVMTNVIYDFNFGWPITPHLGAGIGAVNVSEDVSFNGGASPRSVIVTTGFGSTSRSAWAFGYQAIVGARYEITPIIALDVDYRYLATAGFTLTGTCPFTIAPFRGCDGHMLALKSGYNTNNFVASLTMKFGAPPPAAPPPAPPAPLPPLVHQVYLVFFDWDRYNITPEGMQILEAAAAHSKAGGAVRIQVTGYTDLSGPAGYNQRLSERRANAVAVALERLGVPRNDMIVAGRGMNDPRVPTALGVREPQNRRVEIVFP